MGGAIAGGEAEVRFCHPTACHATERADNMFVHPPLAYVVDVRNDELQRILERVVEIGLRGGWAEFQDSPVQLPRVQLGRRPGGSASTLSIENEDNVDLPKEEHSISDLPPQDTKIDVAKDGGKAGSDKGKPKNS